MILVVISAREGRISRYDGRVLTHRHEYARPLTFLTTHVDAMRDRPPDTIRVARRDPPVRAVHAS